MVDLQVAHVPSVNNKGFVNFDPVGELKTSKLVAYGAYGQPDRVMCLVDINGTKIPFYVSTGNGGKKSVPTGKWYPFFGFSRSGTLGGGWLNKTAESDINKFYNSPILKEIANVLNKKYPIKLDSKGLYTDTSIPRGLYNNLTEKNPKQYGTWAEQINESLSPVDYGDPNIKIKLSENINNTLKKIAESFLRRGGKIKMKYD